MTWAKFCDGFLDHPKVLRAGEDAANLFMRGCIWCNKHLTDGAIPREALKALTARRDAPALAAKLVTVRLWEETPDGWQVHDWSDHNPTRESVESRREKTRDKVAAWRANRAKPVVSDECNHGRNRVTCEVCNPVSNPAPDPTRPDPTTSQSTPNGVLPAQRGDRATPDAKSKPSKADAPPPPPGTPAAAVVEAIGRSVLAGLVRYPHRFAAAQVAAYPSIDLPLQIAQASAWCVANPQHAPRADGARFLGAWLKRSHDRATSAAASQAQRVDGRHPTPSLFDGPRPVPARRVVVGESERELREYLNTHGASRD